MSNMVLELTRYFYLLMEKPLVLLLSSFFLLPGGTVQPENTYTYSCILTVTGQA